jgi:hypothetical protein
MDKQLIDIYSDYLICSFGMTTATGLSSLLDGAISHDKITRFLSGSDFTSADLWHLVKPLVRQIQSEEAVLVIDDSIEEKLYTNESELICWHWDHCFGRNVKGVNFLTCLYRTQDAAIPVAFELLKKSLWEINKKTGKPKRVCPKTKNDYFREMVAQCRKNQLLFRYVLADSWFGSAENMVYLSRNITPTLSSRSRRTARSHSPSKTSWQDAMCPFPRFLWKRMPYRKSGWRGWIFPFCFASRSLQTRTAARAFSIW